MNNFFIILSILLIPIFILLFVRQIRRKRVSYSFTFLQRFKSQSFKQILLKLIQLFYDIIFDITIAIILSLVFANLIININISNRVACVIDGSYSMMKTDINGISPFDKAVLYYYTHKNNYKSFDIFAATFNEKNCKSEIVSINKLKKIINPKSFTDIFQKSFFPFNFDVDLLIKSKKLNKYKKVIFLTDIFPYNTNQNIEKKFEIVEMGKVDKDFFYPISIIYEPLSDMIFCLFLKSKGSYLPKVEIYDKKKLFIKAEDKVKIDFNNENSIIIKTNEKTLLKVSLFNQTYYINLANIPFLVESKGKYPDILKSIIFNDSIYQSFFNKFKERGFNIENKRIPILAFFQGDSISEYINKIRKSSRKDKKIVAFNIEFNNNDIDLIIDPELTGGFLIGANEENLIATINLLKKAGYPILENYLLYNTNNDIKKDTNIYPININSKFILKPQIIIYFYMLSGLVQNTNNNSQINFINNINSDKIKNLSILETNSTSILYKKGEKLYFKNIDINEIYTIKNQQEYEFERTKDSIIIYLIILSILFLSKFLAFLFLKTK